MASASRIRKQYPNARPLLFIVVFYAAWVIRLAVLPLTDPPQTAFFNHLVVGTIARAAIWCLLPAVWLILVERRAVASALCPVDGYSIRLLSILALLLAALLLLGMRFTRGQWFMIPGGHSPVEYIAFVAAVGLLALGEEFTFRGVFLSGLLRGGWPFWIANVIVAFSFALSHWPGWFMFGGIGAIDLAAATMRLFTFGFVMGGLVRIEGGLVTAIAIHTLNDVLVGTLL